MCKKDPEVCKAKIKCKHCINTIDSNEVAGSSKFKFCIDKIKEHDKISLEVQEVDKLYMQVENIIVVK